MIILISKEFEKNDWVTFIIKNVKKLGIITNKRMQPSGFLYTIKTVNGNEYYTR